jgi:hypothetical protein
VLTDPQYVLLFCTVGVALVVLRVAYDRTASGRRTARQLYSSSPLPYVFQMTPVIAPFIGVAVFALGLASLFPWPGPQLVSGTAICSIGIVVLCSYRAPRPGMADWMREEIVSGSLELTRPRGLDWLISWTLAVLVALGIPSMLALVLVYGAGNP